MSADGSSSTTTIWPRCTSASTASRARALYAELRRLPAGEQAVLELVALDGLSVGEAGRALGIGGVAARVRLHRARRRLRDRLDLPTLGASDLPEVTT